jgi:hypothetical protein
VCLMKEIQNLTGRLAELHSWCSRAEFKAAMLPVAYAPCGLTLEMTDPSVSPCQSLAQRG